jgi:serine/threonine protein kinase
MTLSTGQVLNNRYRIVALLAKGGFGAVYRAWDMNLSVPVALKENLTATPESVKQFTLEARLLANLRHESLPYVIDHFSLPGQAQYLVMEYVEGQDLQDMLDKAGGPLPEGQVVGWMVKVCEAVSYLHSQSPPVIHRDIKPANIKVTPQGKVMLVDFGIAKLYDPSLKTAVAARAVTQGFSPPEQYGSGKTEARSDVYALGATLYAALTGQTPIDSLQRKMGGAFPAPRQLNPLISPGVEQAILQAMELEIDQRFRGVAGFKNALVSASGVGQVFQREPAHRPAPQFAMPATAPHPTSLPTQVGSAPGSQAPTFHAPHPQQGGVPGSMPIGSYAPGRSYPQTSESRRSGGWLSGVAVGIIGACLLVGILAGVGLYAFGFFPGHATATVQDGIPLSLSLAQTSTALDATVRAHANSTTPPPSATLTWTSTHPPIITSTSTVSPSPLPSPTWSSTPPPSSTATENPQSTWQPCPAAYASRLHVGDRAYISYNPPLPNRVRSQPGLSGAILGALQVGEKMQIIGGPVCANNWIWWRVSSLEQNLSGWTAEGDEKDYWLVPLP